jgi:anaerobic magnesium-protoporphyrin IX monomethyl ester cyclase
MRVAFVFSPAWAPWAPSYAMALLDAQARKRGHEFSGFDLNIDFYNAVSSADKNLWLDENVLFWLDALRVRRFVDANSGFLDDYIKKVVSTGARLYAFSVQTASSMFASVMAEKIKRFDPGSFVLFGGADCFRAERGVQLLENPSIDAICTGEGDLFWPEFLDLFERNGFRPARIEGLVFRNSDGTLVDCGDPKLPTDLDSLPFANYGWADFNKYSLNNRACLMMSRGCINRCSFCSESPNFIRYRYRTAGNLFEEVKLLVPLLRESSGAKPFINFSDSLINGRPEVLREFCTLVIAEGLEFNWGGMAFLRKEMDRQLLDIMKAAGCVEIMWGLESGCDAVLRLMRKSKYSSKVAEEIIRTTYDLGISQCANFIVGFPGETEQMFLESAMFLLRNKRHFKNFGLPLMEIKKNSWVYAHYRDYGIENPDEHMHWKTTDGLNTYELRMARRDLLSAILENRLFDQGKYDYEFSVKSKWHDQCDRLARQIVHGGTEEVIVYGAGEVGRAFLAVATKAGLAVRCVVDRNQALWGQAIEGVPICSLQDAFGLGLHKYFVASFSYVDEIREQIEACYRGSAIRPDIYWEKLWFNSR